MPFLVTVIAFAIVFGVVVFLAGRAAHRDTEDAAHRWGTVVVSREDAVGDGAFRTAAVTEEHARRIPGLVRGVGLVGATLAMFSPVALAPLFAGLGFSLASLEHRDLEGVLCLALAFAVFFGSYFVHSVSIALVRNEPGAGQRARTISTAMLVVCAPPTLWFGLGSGPHADMMRTAGVAFGMLLLLAFALFFAGRRVAAIQAEMSPDELAAFRGPLPAARRKRRL